MKKYFLLICFFVSSFLWGQNKKTDSLFAVLKTLKQEDTSKVNTLNALAYEFRNNNPDTAIYFATAAMQLSEKMDYKIGIAEAKIWCGVANMRKGKNDIALKYSYEAKKICKQLISSTNKYSQTKTIVSLSWSYNTIGCIYMGQGNYPDALKNHFDALKIREELKNKEGVGQSFFNIGSIYIYQNNYKNALIYLKKSLKTRKEINDKQGIWGSYLNIAAVYYYQNNFSEAIKNFSYGQKIAEELGDKNGVAASYQNIASIYVIQKKYPEALNNLTIALKIQQEIGDKAAIAHLYGTLGTLKLKINQPKIAKEYLDKALAIAKEIGNKETVKNSYGKLSEIDSTIGDFKQAMKHYKLYILYRDSLFNEENTKKTVQTQMQYEFDKKDAVAKLEQDKKELAHAEQSKRQQYVIFSVIAGLTLVIVFSFFLYRRFKITQKQKILIELQKNQAEEQREIISAQKHLVDEKQKEIVDSINYAKRIQQALLKEEEHVSEHLPEHFVLFKPKDIVSGDFYWALEKSLLSPAREPVTVTLSGAEGGLEGDAGQDIYPAQRHWYIAAADCTGHGVPGAFMSMLGIAFLNEINASEKLLSTSEILNQLREKVMKELNQTGAAGDSKDGMDISLARLALNPNPSPAGEGDTLRVQWSGANNSIYHFNNGTLNEIKADKQPIGYHPMMKPFTEHNLILQKGDSIFLFTDGYADQFGGPKKKKFLYKRFEEMLQTNAALPMEEQKNVLNKAFEDWKGDMEQIDDVCVIGIRL